MGGLPGQDENCTIGRLSGFSDLRPNHRCHSKCGETFAPPLHYLKFWPQIVAKHPRLVHFKSIATHLNHNWSVLNFLIERCTVHTLQEKAWCVNRTIYMNTKCTSSAENDACMRRSLYAPRKCILPHTAALQLNRTPLRMMGPNCAAGLVLVLSVDTVLQFDTEHSSREVVHEQCIGHGAGRGHRGRRKVWLTV